LRRIVTAIWAPEVTLAHAPDNAEEQQRQEARAHLLLREMGQTAWLASAQSVPGEGHPRSGCSGDP
jgi:hypothetical protein